MCVTLDLPVFSVKVNTFCVPVCHGNGSGEKKESTSKLAVEKSRSQATNARMQSPPCLRQTCAVLTELPLPFDAAYALHMRDDLSEATARVTVSPIWSELITDPQLHI